MGVFIFVLYSFCHSAFRTLTEKYPAFDRTVKLRRIAIVTPSALNVGHLANIINDRYVIIAWLRSSHVFHLTTFVL